MADYRRIFRLFLGTSGDAEREVEEEIRGHLELRAAEYERRGMSPQAARAEAERRFGDMEGACRRLRARSRERVGRQRRRDWLASLVSDVALALRRARKAPGHTAISLATFALGIGLTTAGFTVVDRVLLRSLPFPEADRLVALQTRDDQGDGIVYLSSQIWLDWQEQASTLAGSALYGVLPERLGLASADDAFHVEGRRVTPAFFDVLGVRMLGGRGFRDDDEGHPVVVVSEGLWRRVLGEAPLPVEIDLAGSMREVVGVVPRGMEYPLGTEAYVLHTPKRRGGESYNSINFFGIARLGPGMPVERAESELAAIVRGVHEEHPEGQYLYGAGLMPLREMVVGEARHTMLLLMGAVVVLLLIACANLAGLGLARSSVRGQEVALRRALGAGRRRLIRQFLTEHVVLALVGGALGIGLAVLATSALAAGAAEHIPRASEIAVDGRILGFAVAVSLLSGVLAGMVPAIWASRGSLREALGSGRAGRGGRNRTGAVVVGVEVALALVLLTGGSLLVRSFANLLSRDLGFDVEGVVTVDGPLLGRYDMEQWAGFWPQIEHRLRPLPGVAAVGFTNAVPTGESSTGFIEVEGFPDPRPGAGYRVISDGYFDAIGIDRVAGRTFGPEDGEGTARVAVINRAMAERFWPGESPIGGRVKAYSHEGSDWGDPDSAPWIEVVGVVDDVRQGGPADDRKPEMFVSMRQVPLPWQLSQMVTVVRGQPGVSAATLVGPVREAFRAQDPRLAVQVRTMSDRVSALLSRTRLILLVLTGFAGLSLLLASIGLYGMLSFSVAQNWKEMGIRTALGARPSGLLSLVLGRALRVIAAGILAGIVLALGLSRVMESLVVDTPPRDVASFLAAVVVLGLVGVAAALVPAVRATRADPVEALRS